MNQPSRPRRPRLNPLRDDQHGSRTGYLSGCRCADCRAANAAYITRYRQSKRQDACIDTKAVLPKGPDDDGIWAPDLN